MPQDRWHQRANAREGRSDGRPRMDAVDTGGFFRGCLARPLTHPLGNQASYGKSQVFIGKSSQMIYKLTRFNSFVK